MGDVIAVPLSRRRRAAAVLAARRRLEAEYRVGPQAAGGAGGMTGLAIAAAGAGARVGVPWVGDRLRGPWWAPQALLPGLALGWAIDFGATRRERWAAPGDSRADATDGAEDVTWLVSYVTLEPDGSGPGRVRVSVLRITLPAAAEGRLTALLERAGATAAG